MQPAAENTSAIEPPKLVCSAQLLFLAGPPWGESDKTKGCSTDRDGASSAEIELSELFGDTAAL
jgi:hypothetical protein